MTSPPATQRPKIGVILGATRGIGRALAKALAQQWCGEGRVYLTGRSAEDAARVAMALSAENVEVHPLVFDLADPMAAARTAKTLKELHGGVDLVVQNGAYVARANVPARDDARPMIEANNHGTLRVLESFLPVLNDNGRLIIVASGFGILDSLPVHLRDRFDTTQADPAAINRVMDGYVEAVEADRADAEGWPEWVNIPSKVGQVAVTRAFARRAKQTKVLPSGALINAACPGVTLTDATRDFMDTVFKGQEVQTPEQAADDVLWLATLPAGTDAPYGELVQHRKIIPYGDESP